MSKCCVATASEPRTGPRFPHSQDSVRKGLITVFLEDRQLFCLCQNCKHQSEHFLRMYQKQQTDCVTKTPRALFCLCRRARSLGTQTAQRCACAAPGALCMGLWRTDVIIRIYRSEECFVGKCTWTTADFNQGVSLPLIWHPHQGVLSSSHGREVSWSQLNSKPLLGYCFLLSHRESHHFCNTQIVLFFLS